MTSDGAQHLSSKSRMVGGLMVNMRSMTTDCPILDF